MSDQQAFQRSQKEPLPSSNGKTNGVLPRLDMKPGHPRETIDEASRSVNRVFPKDSVHVSPAELRKNFKVRVSGDLARGLWYLLGFVVVIHLISTIAFSWRLSNKPTTGDNDKERTERIGKATSTVNDTAKTLYAVLGVLTTAVTGYYFTSGSNSASSDNVDEKEH